MHARPQRPAHKTLMPSNETVDSNLEQETGKWTFDEDVAEEFDHHVRRSIPHYDEIQSRVVKLADWFLQMEGEERVYDLGCATGTTIEKLVSEYGARGPPEFVGFDLQPPMLAKARERCSAHQNVSFQQADITDQTFSNASLVISLFTMSFLPEGDRQALVEQIYEDLDRGGAFIFTEKTRAKSPLFQDIWNQEYWDYKAEQGLTEEEITERRPYHYGMNVLDGVLRGQLRPLTVERYEAMLSSAGFDVENDVDIFIKWFPWTGFIARKS